VSGFRIDAVPRLYENQTYVDEPYFKGKEGSKNYRDINHIYTRDQPEVIDTLIEWRQFIDLYTKTQNYSYPRYNILIILYFFHFFQLSWNIHSIQKPPLNTTSHRIYAQTSNFNL